MTVPTADDLAALFASLRNWGRWGDDDERGALNHLRPEHRQRAATLVVDGATLWTHEVAGTDGTGVTEDIDLELHVGSTVDWLLHPIQYDSQDTTSYDITIRSR